MTRPRESTGSWWDWRGLSQVARLERYTLWSLLLLLWLLPLIQVLGWGGSSLSDGARTILLLGVLPATVVATPLLVRQVAEGGLARFADLGRTGPLLAVLLVVPPVLWHRLLEGADRAVAVLGLAWVAGWALGGVGGRTPVVVLVGSALAGTLLGGWPLGIACAGMSAFMIFTVYCSLWVLRVVRELDTTRRAQSALAVAEERLRFSRDVHDVMGRHLSQISVRADLAATLAERGIADQAAATMREVQEDATRALAEARELARGYREPDLAHEIEGARSLLEAAGARCTVAIDDLPAPWREPAAWVVREAVTNVLRHSEARTVEIRGGADGLLIRNDRPRRSGESGIGLVGLRERLAPLGLDLVAGAAEDRYELRMEPR